MRADYVILIVLLVVGAAAFALEAAGPDAARWVGIGVCLLLLFLLGGGLYARMRRRGTPTQGEADHRASVSPDSAS